MAAPSAVEVSPAVKPVVSEAVALLSSVADPVRWMLVAHLAARGETCVCRLQEAVAVAPNLLSYHLRLLRDAGLVTTRRRGRWVDYSLAEGAVERVAAALPLSPKPVT